MTKDRIIFHCDLNSFFASVEEVLNPELKKVPMSVAGDPETRHGIILASNKLAKKFGVKTAETIWQARRKCPNLVLVSPQQNEYYEYSKKAFAIYGRYTDLVESFGCDEAWLDVTHSYKLFVKTPLELANLIRETMKKELGLTVSIGISFNKVFAKLGSDYKKPDAVTKITRENGKKIVFPLPATDLLMVGKKSAIVLERLGIKTIGDLAHFDKDTLSNNLGILGETLWLYANGKDESPVNPIREKEKSIGNGRTFEKDIKSYEELFPRVAKLAESVGWRCRQKKVKVGVIQVTIKSPALSKIQRQRKLQTHTNITREIRDIAMEIIKENWREGKPIRSITITASSLVDSENTGVQTSFFDTGESIKSEKLQEALDNLKLKYGEDIIT